MKAGPAVLLALIILGAALPLARADALAQGHAPAALSASVIPPLLPADSAVYPALVISLVDSGGAPTLSLADITVYLSSSNSSVASVPASVTLPAGHAFVQVPVTTSGSPGSATLAAATNGLVTGTASLKTVALAAGPSALSLYLSPSKSLTALAGDGEVFAVQLVNARGQPSVSSSATSLMITSSDGSVLAGPIGVTIPAGSDVGYGQFKVSQGGAATLTAIAQDLATGTAQLDVAPAEPVLTITPSPGNVTAGGVSTLFVSVSVLGMPAPGANVTLSVTSGELVPSGLITADNNGQAIVKYISSSPGVALVTGTASGSLIGTVSGSAQVLVNPTGTSNSAGPLGQLTPYVPVIVVAAAVVVGFVMVRTTLRRRRGKSVEEPEYPRSNQPT